MTNDQEKKELVELSKPEYRKVSATARAHSQAIVGRSDWRETHAKKLEQKLVTRERQLHLARAVGTLCAGKEHPTDSTAPQCYPAPKDR